MPVSGASDLPKVKQPFSLGWLRWVAITLPVLFLASLDVLRHTIFSQQLHTIRGYIGTYIFIAVAVIIFSYTIFALVERLQKKVVDQNRQLSALNEIALLYEQSLLQNRELGALLAVGWSSPLSGKIVTSSIELDKLLDASLDTLIEVTSVEAAEIWLLEANNNEEIAIRCHRGANREAFLEQPRFAVGEGILGIVAQSREPIVVHDLSHDARFQQQPVARSGFRTFCAMPIKYQGKLVGILTVAAMSPDALKEQWEIRHLESVGEWLALSIENSRLYQHVQDVAVIQERARIAQEMHDGMAQTLGYINTQTMAVRKLLSNGQAAEAGNELTRMEEIARDLYADVREGILGLRTTTQHQKGLVPTLREYAERYTEAFAIPVGITISPEAERLQLPLNAEVQLLRVVQEALTNVRKHAKATTVAVTFECNNRSDELQVTIADNGRGFELTRLPSTGWPHFGLQTMRERAEAVGGTLQVDSAPGQGTRVRVHIPVAQVGWVK